MKQNKRSVDKKMKEKPLTKSLLYQLLYGVFAYGSDYIAGNFLGMASRLAKSIKDYIIGLIL